MATPEEAQFAAQFKGSTKPDQTTPEAAQFNKQFYGASSTDKPKEADTSNTGAAIALGAADLFGGLSTMGGFIGKGFEALGGYDFPVLTRRNNQWGLTPISQASFEDAVGSSENLARVFNSVGINTEFTPDRTKGEEWKNTATRFAVGGLPFIVKSIATSLGKEGIKAALRTAAQETGAVAGSAGAMQLAEDQGPGGQLIAAVIGDVLGRHPVRAVTTTPVTAAKGGAGLYSKAKSVVRGREPRERAAELMHKLVPDPDALRQLIDTHPDAKSLYDLPGTINTKELIDRVAALSPEARVQFMRAAKQTQAKMISKLVDDNVTEGVMSAQNQVGSNFDEMRLTAIKANDKALKSVAAAIDGLDGGNVEGLANNAKRVVLEAREEVRKGISQQFDAIPNDLKTKHFVDVVKNTKASYVGREADIPNLPEINNLHKRII
ncbi:MAG TPA: hypothetical protein DIT58_01795, partial [Porticoccaceae bacterium]|nr:hypothetical protein [Porticoccaceae bacterium]